MVVILLRLRVVLLLSVDEPMKSPIDDVVAEVVVRVLCDNGQLTTTTSISKTDLNEDEEDEGVLVMLEVLFADCVCRGQRHETPEVG